MSLLRKTFVLGLGAGAARLLGAAILVLLARVLGVERFGIFGYAMSVALLLEVAIDMGQSVNVARLVARDERSGAAFGDLALNKLALTALGAVAAGLFVRLAHASAEEALTVALMVVWAGFLSLLDSERAVGRSLGMFAADSLVNSLESVGRVLAVSGAWALGLGLAGYGAAFALECAVAAAAFYAVLSRRVRLAPPRLSLRGSLRFLRSSVPLGLTGIAFVGFYQIDQVFVRALAGAEANGLYAAATRVVFAANTLGSLVVMAAYPDLARLRDDISGFRQRCGQMLGLAAGIGAAVAGVTLMLAGPIVTLLYGPAFAGTEPLLRVLAPIVLMDAVVVGAVYAGNALGRERRVLAVVAAMFAVNVVANAVLVPVFGALAAAWVSTLGEAGLAAALLAVCWDRLVLPAPSLEADAC